ncbi:MAG: TetR family transcriptional regulator [Spirochaetales bacterium]|nr:TetR family transcriptional regulator [Spirochaetales bacterium]
MCKEFRARNEEQKMERKEAILSAASGLFGKSDLGEVSMAEIASKCGLSKGTLFFYFATKEGLFLALAEKKISQWHSHFNGLLEEKGMTIKRPEEFIELLEFSIHNHPDVIRLYALLNTTLEKNVDADTVYRFKLFLKKNMQATGQLLEKYLPFLKKGDGFFLLMSAFVFICGIFPMSNPDEGMKEVLSRPGMEVFDVKFERTFREMYLIFLRGMNRQ